MKILYAIQGTGNGHISRARDIIPILEKKGDLDILVSGIQADVGLPHQITYSLKGLSFIFGKKGGVDIWETIKRSDIGRLIKEIKTLPVEQYDLVINDFEPVSAWACKLKKKKCIGLSHQAAVIHPLAPKPGFRDLLGETILKRYAPVSKSYGFHFETFAEDIFPPVIRKQIREAQPTDGGHYTVYLPAYGDEWMIAILKQIPVPWQVFSKHTKKSYQVENVHIRPVDNDAFINSMITCTGMLCGAGFETPAEALFLRKKLMVIPMKGQYEQHCNAAGANRVGVPVIPVLAENQISKILNWTTAPQQIEVNYPDITEQIIDKLIADFIK